MPNIYIFYVFMTALFVALILVPPILQLSARLGKFDLPDVRKIHGGKISRLAGIAIFSAVILSVVLYLEMDRFVRGFIAGGLIVFATGLYDDFAGLRPHWKFAGEVLAALVAILISRVSIDNLGDLFGFGDIHLGLLSIPFTVIGIVGVTNAFNLLDGLDGLSGGCAAIAALALGLMAYLSGNNQVLFLALALAGAIIGFLKFNTYPAKIFMGDGGSLFLGFSLAFLAVLLCCNNAGKVSPATPLIILAVPIVDSFIVMAERIRSRRSIFLPDNSHVHHRLLGIGLGHQWAVIVIYALSYLAAIAGLFSNNLPDYLQIVLVVLIYIILSSLHLIISPELLSNVFEDMNEKSLRRSPSFMTVLNASGRVVAIAKYLILFVLVLPLFLFSSSLGIAPVIAGIMLLLSTLLFFITNDLSNRFLHLVIYLEGAYIVFLVENFGREPVVGMFSLHHFSHAVFLLLFICCGLKVFLDRKILQLMESPLDFLLFFTVISIPLLPPASLHSFHLLSVASKSVILFAAYRLVLMNNARRNRKVLMATMLALLFVVLKAIPWLF